MTNENNGNEIDMSAEMEKDQVAYERMSEREQRIHSTISSLSESVANGECTGMRNDNPKESYARHKRAVRYNKADARERIARTRRPSPDCEVQAMTTFTIYEALAGGATMSASNWTGGRLQ